MDIIFAINEILLKILVYIKLLLQQLGKDLLTGSGSVETEKGRLILVCASLTFCCTGLGRINSPYMNTASVGLERYFWSFGLRGHALLSFGLRLALCDIP